MMGARREIHSSRRIVPKLMLAVVLYRSVPTVEVAGGGEDHNVRIETLAKRTLIGLIKRLLAGRQLPLQFSRSCLLILRIHRDTSRVIFQVYGGPESGQQI